MWLLLLGAGEVCGVILGEWRGEDPADNDIPEEEEKTFLREQKLGFKRKTLGNKMQTFIWKKHHVQQIL